MSQTVSVSMVDKWKEESKRAIKTKMVENICQRAPILQRTINKGICETIAEDSKPIQQFEFPQSLINNAKVALFEHVAAWRGVDIKARHNAPTNWKEYHKTADNWWNRYKSKWIGDHFIYPLLSQILTKYIIQITQQHYKTDNKYNGMELMRDILFFNILLEIMCAEVTFAKTKAQPLILDQSYTKSKLLKQFMLDLGNKHHQEWRINTHQNRYFVRNAAKEWAKGILAKKVSIFNRGDSNISTVRTAPWPAPRGYAHRSNRTQNEEKLEALCEITVVNDDNPPSMDTVMVPVCDKNVVPLFEPILYWNSRHRYVHFSSSAPQIYCSANNSPKSISAQSAPHSVQYRHPYQSRISIANNMFNSTNNFNCSSNANSLIGAVICTGHDCQCYDENPCQCGMVNDDPNANINVFDPNYPLLRWE